MHEKMSNQYIQGALILTTAAFIVKLLSAIYRVPFQNIVGDVGFYIYQQVYPIYGIGSVLATSGFPVILSKIAAQSLNGKRQYLVYSMQAAFLTLFLVGFSLFCLFFFGANLMANGMGDPLLAPLIKIISITFLFLPFFSIGRGYFQSVGNMVPTAMSQVVEQCVRVCFILLFAYFAVANGNSLYMAGSGALTGSLIGSGAGLILLIYFGVKYKLIKHLFLKGLSFRKFYKTAQIILIHGAGICITGMMLILFQLIDSFSLYSLLVQSGVDREDAKALKGIFDRGQPLIQLGTVAASSFALALVPLIASAWIQNKEKIIQEKSVNAVKLTTVIGVGAAIGLANIIKPTNSMLFGDESGSSALAILSLSIIFSSLILVCAGILQGLGHVLAPAKYIMIGLVVKAGCNWLFTPFFGTDGAAISTIIGLVIITYFIVKKLNGCVCLVPVLKKMMVGLSMAALCMTLILQLWLLPFSLVGTGRFISSISALTGVLIGGLVYLTIIIKTRTLTQEELEILPFGKRLKQIYNNKK